MPEPIQPRAVAAGGAVIGAIAMLLFGAIAAAGFFDRTVDWLNQAYPFEVRSPLGVLFGIVLGALVLGLAGGALGWILARRRSPAG